jgi:hypothetical protein
MTGTFDGVSHLLLGFGHQFQFDAINLLLNFTASDADNASHPTTLSHIHAVRYRIDLSGTDTNFCHHAFEH